MDEWVVEWIDEWGRWRDGWVGGWMERCGRWLEAYRSREWLLWPSRLLWLMGPRCGGLEDKWVMSVIWWKGGVAGRWEVGHVNLHPLQAPATGAGACGPGPERGTPPAALLDLPAQGREGPDHCGLCPGGHLSGQPPSGSAGRGGEQRPGRVGSQGLRGLKPVFALLGSPSVHLRDRKALGSLSSP